MNHDWDEELLVASMWSTRNGVRCLKLVTVRANIFKTSHLPAASSSPP